LHRVDVVLERAIQDVQDSVRNGESLTRPLAQHAVFPPMVVQIFALGQQSGRLEEMLDRLATAYQQQVSSAAQRFTAVLEPAMIVTLALFVLFIVMATVLPILEAGNAIQ